jgi:hypothetical protein
MVLKKVDVYDTRKLDRLVDSQLEYNDSLDVRAEGGTPKHSM